MGIDPPFLLMCDKTQPTEKSTSHVIAMYGPATNASEYATYTN